MQKLTEGRRIWAVPACLLAVFVLFKSAPIHRLGSGLSAVPEGYNYIRSITTRDGRFFETTFSDHLTGFNPNIIPHPTKPDTFYLVALRVPNSHWFTELTCEATFNRRGNELKCREPVLIAPIAATKSGLCEGNIHFFHYNVGPHDARVFYGPEYPYIMYGSNSQHNCFGLWAQDFRLLVNWPTVPNTTSPLRFPMDLPRPAPVGAVEKNWFMFWDHRRDLYLHYDVAPHRAFAKLEADGSVGRDLASSMREQDDRCLAAYGPKMVNPNMESIHQATNSLEIIMCRRADTACRANAAEKTFIMHIFQHKTFYNYHSLYEPFVMLFSNKPPFALHGISKPFWVAGRRQTGLPTAEHVNEMFYMTSMNWKGVDNKYSGFLDDVLLIGFGIEDSRGAGIDVTAESLLGQLSLCSAA